MNNITNFNEQEITLEDSTKLFYVNKSKFLYKKAKRELGINNDEEIDERQLVMWLIDNMDKVNKKTYRVYKSSLIYYFLNEIKTESSVEAAEYLAKITSEKSYKKSDKTSAQKMKRIPSNDLEKLIKYLDEHDGKWNLYIKNWILSAIICGLRPIEWKDSEIISYEGKTALKIKNAKHTNGRAHGEFRIILLNNLTEDELNLINEHIYSVKEFDKIGEYDKFYRNCVAQLNTVNNKIFGRRKKNITLYSARHQFSANAKSAGKSKREIAALMGHKVDKTATIHYGKGRFGSSSLSVEPSQEDVEKVIENSPDWYKKYKEKRDEKKSTDDNLNNI